MGFSIYDVELLSLLKAKGIISKPMAVIDIGAQQLANDMLKDKDKITRLGKEFGIKSFIDLPAPLPTVIIEGGKEHLSESAPYARIFWEWLGCTYAAIDVDGSPGSIPLDLNFDGVPSQHRKRYDLVYNSGTTEHVANQLNAFKVIHDLTSIGGTMIHCVPAQGCVNHGLINYNPKFFWMLARSNGYRYAWFDFRQSGTPYATPKNVLDNIALFDQEAARRKSDYKVQDSGLAVVLQKAFDIEFVPPLDVPTDSRANNATMLERYWTVFTPNAFDNVGSSPQRGRLSKWFRKHSS